MAAINRFQRRRLLNRQSDIDGLRDLTWQEFEMLVGEAYRCQGYAVEESGGGGADGGVDLRLRRDGETFIVQCKRWKTRQVGVSPVRELYGLMRAENAEGSFFVSSGTYTPDAKRFAEDNGVVLIDGDGLFKLIQTVQSVSTPVQPEQITRAGTPICPACGGSMVLRTARHGKNVGQNFWGCMSYPNCRGIIGIT